MLLEDLAERLFTIVSWSKQDRWLAVGQKVVYLSNKMWLTPGTKRHSVTNMYLIYWKKWPRIVAMKSRSWAHDYVINDYFVHITQNISHSTRILFFTTKAYFGWNQTGKRGKQAIFFYKNNYRWEGIRMPDLRWLFFVNPVHLIGNSRSDNAK